MNIRFFSGWQAVLIAIYNAGGTPPEALVMTDAQLLSKDRGQVEELLLRAAAILKIPAGVEVKLNVGFQTYSVSRSTKVEI